MASERRAVYAARSPNQTCRNPRALSHLVLRRSWYFCSAPPCEAQAEGRERHNLLLNGRSGSMSGFPAHELSGQRGQDEMRLYAVCKGTKHVSPCFVMPTRNSRAKLPCWALVSDLRYMFATAWRVLKNIRHLKYHSQFDGDGARLSSRKYPRFGSLFRVSISG
jgi:hypothetical protein